jgi:hypothetical protein
MSARKPYRPPPGHYQGGFAAVEMALLSFVMALFLLAPIMIARSLMQVTLTQRVAYNAVHMIAEYPPFQRVDTSSNPVSEATAMADEALVAGGIGSFAVGAANCTNSTNCTNKLAPTVIGIAISADVLDPGTLLPTFTTVNVTTGASDRYSN